jgi:PAS domain S-box-containing protein
MTFLGQVMTTGEKMELETTGQFNNNSSYTHSFILVPEKDIDGNTMGVIAFGRDITERKRLEQEIKESHDFIERIIDSIPVPVFVKDHKHRFILSNDAFNKFSGHTREEINGKTDNDYYLKEEVKRFYDQEELCFATEKEHLFEDTIVDSTGKECHLFIRKSVFTGLDGKKYLTGTVNDVTVLKNTEKRLLEESHKLAEAQRIGSLCAWEYNIVTDQIIASGDIFRIYKKESQESISISYKRFLQVVHPDDREAVNKVYKDSLSKRKQSSTCSFEHRLILPDGSIIYVHQYWENIFDNSGKPVLTRGAIQDITNRKQTELELIEAKKKAEESNRLKTAFLATVNHEIRTPLNHILGFSEILSKGNEDSSKYGKIINQSGKQLLEMFEDMIDLSMVNHTDVLPRNQTVSVGSLFNSSKKLLEEILEASGKKDKISLVFSPDVQLISKTIETDVFKVHNILNNLFKNAVKFTEKGKVELGFFSKEKDWITISIKDTGIGIPKENLETIYDMFRKCADTSTQLYDGIGVGLSISRQIADLLKGSLDVESQFGKGSVFYLNLPVQV